MTSSPLCWCSRPPEVVHFSIVLSVFRGWLKTSYTLIATLTSNILNLSSERYDSKTQRRACEAREDHAYGALRLPKREENDCFAVYLQ